MWDVKSSGKICCAVSELTAATASSVHPTAVHQLFSSVPGYAGMARNPMETVRQFFLHAMQLFGTPNLPLKCHARVLPLSKDAKS